MNRSFLSRLVTVGLICAVVFVVFATAAELATACPSCKAALASGKDGDHGDRGDIAGGYQWSILFMMSMPFALLGGFGLYCYCKIRHAAKAVAPPTVRNGTAPPPVALQDG